MSEENNKPPQSEEPRVLKVDSPALDALLKEIKQQVKEKEQKNAPKPKKTYRRGPVPKAKQFATVIITPNGTSVSRRNTLNGPTVFGVHPLKWFYRAYNRVQDYFLGRKYYTFLKFPLYDRTVKAAVNHVDRMRMIKVGEVNRPGASKYEANTGN